MKRFLSILFFLGFLLPLRAQQDYASMVNPFIGTQGNGLACGFLFAGAAYPHGMVQFTPSFFSKDIGFVVNQESGAGCGNLGNFPTFPVKGKLESSPGNMKRAGFSLSDEKAHAGDYSADVQEDIKAELTVTARTGMARYTWPEDTDYGTVVIGAGVSVTFALNAAAVITAPNRCEGYAIGGEFCGEPTPYKIYFVAEFDAEAVETGIWKKSSLHPGATFAEGEHSGLYFTFDTRKNQTVQYKIGISYVSVENARENLETENPLWSFDSTRKAAENRWNSFLSLIDTEGGSRTHRIQFYTHLYRAFIEPSLCSDVNGEYMGADWNIHKTSTSEYAMFSNWDTYRCQIQLLAILEPDVATDIVLSHQHFAEQTNGTYPHRTHANLAPDLMNGDPSPIIVSNAWAFGARGFDPSTNLAIMRKGAETPGIKCQDGETRRELSYYLESGNLNSSWLLEYTASDFAIGRFALQALGEKDVAAEYTRRADKWRVLFNPETGWLQSRNHDGTWKSLEKDWCEATYKDYMWMIPFNLQGVIDIVGGKAEAERRLDEYFTRLDATYDDEWFASGNEPSFGTPWVYNWTGSPWKTQKVINRTLNEQYFDRPDGLPGNDDLGTMGAWYVWCCIGLYPEIPGVAGFTVNTPIFSKAVIRLPGGNITITGGSETAIFTKGLKINGKAWDSTWIDWDVLKDGATLQFKTSEKPDRKWGTKVVPPSFWPE